ncbi:hypothetical protein Ancab_014283 [Ancistrocladus abbreviatus]
MAWHSGEICRGDTQLKEWYFFVPRQEREAQGGRPNRLTQTGYWKASGSPSWVISFDNRFIGHKRTMVFYKGRCPAGTKTQWKLNEYKAVDHLDQQLRLEYSLCRVYTESKCIRSFDRRPFPSSSSSSSSGMVKGRSPAVQSPPDDQQPIAANLQNPPVESHSSGDHSSSNFSDRQNDGGGEGDPRPSQSFGGDNGSHCFVEFENLPFWEWDEELNLF